MWCVLKRIFSFLSISGVAVLSLASCVQASGPKTSAADGGGGTGSIVGGTDKILSAVNGQLDRLTPALASIAANPDDICALSQRQNIGSDFPWFNSLPVPTAEQIAACKSLLGLSELAKNIADKKSFPIQVATAPLFLDPPTNKIPLIAQAPIAAAGPISVSASLFDEVSYTRQLIALGHEFLHTVSVTYDPVAKIFNSTPGRGHLDSDIVAGLQVRQLFDYVASAWALRATRESVPHDFGGAWGYMNGTPTANPATGNNSCPPGYFTQQALGTGGRDYPLFYCYRPKVPGQSPILDFGGFVGYVEGAVPPNPMTGSTDCPAGFNRTQILGTEGLDLPMVLCWRAHTVGGAEPYGFGGIFGTVNSLPATNPATAASSCPAGFDSVRAYGTNGVDWSMSYCWKKN